MAKYKSNKKMKIFDAIGSNVLLNVLCIIWLIPVVWIIAASFKKDAGVISPTFFPTELTINNYVKLIEGTEFLGWVKNTIIIAVLNMILTTFVTLLTAYCFSRFRFKSRKPMMNITLILGMFPGFMSMIAVYIILNMLGLVGSIWSLLLVYVSGAGLGFFVCKGYFDTISKAIDEAAIIDGANQFVIFFKIFLPLATPIMIYTALTAFMAPWTDYILAGLVLKDPASYTVAVGLYNMTLESTITTKFTMFAAGSVLIAIPIVILYISLQKFMVEGISSGAVKG